MKRFIFPSFFFLIFSTISFAQSHSKEIALFQQELNKSFKNKDESPLDKKQRRKFRKHDFYPVDSNYKVEAELKRTPHALPFKMKTSTSRLPIYKKYGELHFELNGEAFVLNVYQNNRPQTDEDYANYLFLPFSDETNGVETYGAGRYINISIPEGDTLIIDFNKAYNPYCAYNYRYSCPIPPKENHLNIEVTAGMKNYNPSN